MDALTHHLKRAGLTYGGTVLPLAVIPGTGVTLTSALVSLGVVGIGYGYFSLMRQAF